MRQNFIAQFICLLKPSLCNVWLGVMVEKNWAHSVDQCWLQVFQFSGHLIDLLSIILRCNTFTWIQNTVVDQTGSRPPVTVTFFGTGLGLESALELLSPTTELAVSSCHIQSTFVASQSNPEMVHCCV